MSNGHPAIELSSLPVRHPLVGQVLLTLYGPAVLFRLGVDPTALPSGTMEREIEASWLSRSGGAEVRQGRVIDWTAYLRGGSAEEQRQRRKTLDQLPRVKNDNDLTEEAAIGVAALLIHELEKGVFTTVLEIGSDGDYLVRVGQPGQDIQLEVSGIKVDATGSLSRTRLKDKCSQVLTKARVGFASVTTFAHGSSGVAHSYLHYTKGKKQKPGPGKTKKSKGGKGKKK